MPEPLLSVKGLQAWYGESHVLHGVDLEVRKGELVTVVGRNGAGKTTTLKSIMGMIAKRSGSAVFEGVETIRMPSNQIARLGHSFEMHAVELRLNRRYAAADTVCPISRHA